jgi:hypothetical protein
MGKSRLPAPVGSESLFELASLLDALLARTETPLALGLMAVFAQ